MSEIKLTADSGGGSVSLKGPATTTSNAALPFILPVADGSAGQLLKTDGSKNLGWATDVGGKILQVVSANENNLLQNPTSMTTFFDLDVTPTSASSKFIVWMASFFTLGNNTEMQIICEDGTFTGGIREFRNYHTDHGARIFASAMWFMDQSHSTGSAVTYAVKAHRTSGSDTAQLGSSGTSYKSTMVVMEVAV
tara:strand:- start:1635 stop:2216 length:582 start_codon:yes stop_codon:yes gene_type:complete